MDAPVVIAAVAVAVSMATGFVSITRGTKADRAAEDAAEALNVSANIQTTFTAQKDLVDNLQEEVARCTGECHDLREKNSTLTDRIVTLTDRIGVLERKLVELGVPHGTV